MGTRGSTSFVIDGTTKTGYQQFDSYPSGVGDTVLTFIRKVMDEGRLDEVKEQVRALRVVDDTVKPSAADIKRLKEFHDDRVSTGSEEEWYSLLRNTQGDPEAILRAGVIEDASEFPEKNSLFCEYSYVLDFDAEVFEVHRGFQQHPHNKGRFSHQNASDDWEPSYAGETRYYSVALAASYKFDNLPPSHETLDHDIEVAFPN